MQRVAAHRAAHSVRPVADFTRQLHDAPHVVALAVEQHERRRGRATVERSMRILHRSTMYRQHDAEIEPRHQLRQFGQVRHVVHGVATGVDGHDQQAPRAAHSLGTRHQRVVDPRTVGHFEPAFTTSLSGRKEIGEALPTAEQCKQRAVRRDLTSRHTGGCGMSRGCGKRDNARNEDDEGASVERHHDRSGKRGFVRPCASASLRPIPR